jgi:hypothetical protein
MQASGQLHTSTTLALEPTEKVAGQVPVLVWMLGTKVKSHALYWESNYNCFVNQPVV